MGMGIALSLVVGWDGRLGVGGQLI